MKVSVLAIRMLVDAFNKQRRNLQVFELRMFAHVESRSEIRAFDTKSQIRTEMSHQVATH